jgi:phosphate transport system permease protein
MKRLAYELGIRSEPLIEAAIRLCGWSSIVLVMAILAFVLAEATPAITNAIDLRELIASVNWRPDSVVRPQFGILALVVGSASVTALAMVMTLPIGIVVAMFISEYCSPRAREILKIVIELLAAIPSVVWGFVGYAMLSPLIMWASDAAIGINLLNGAVILALMSVPIVVSIGEDALRAVPDSYREAALALGASRWQLALRVLLPGARHGLLAAALLGVGRAIGETMAVLMATGHAVQIPHSLLDPVRTLTATIAAELGETVAGGVHYRVLFVLGSVLMLISLAVNIAAEWIVRGVHGREAT